MSSTIDVDDQARDLAARWGGGRSPWDVSWGKLMMWLFLISDAMTFAGLLIGLWVTRLASATWPNHLPGVVNLPFVATMTVILICSSTTMAMSVYAIRRGYPREAVWLLTATIIAGLLFAGMQAREWSHFIGDGARLTGNPWGVPAFSFTFFVITGFHLMHVLAGLVYLCFILVRNARGISTPNEIQLFELFWLFVYFGWNVVFVIVYLIPSGVA